MKRIPSLVLAGVLASSLVACQQQPATDNAAADTAANTDSMASTTANNAELDRKVMAALETCKKVEARCGEGTPAGYLVFPDVTSVAFGVGGEGGTGALVENGQIVNYYKMGEGSIGLQAGVTAASYVLELKTPEALVKYEADGQWSIGAEAGVVVASANADAQAQADNATSVLYVFDSKGLMGDVAVNAMKIWRTNDVTATTT